MNITLNINLPAALEVAGTLPAVAATVPLVPPVSDQPAKHLQDLDQAERTIANLRASNREQLQKLEEMNAALSRATDNWHQQGQLIDQLAKVSDCPEGTSLDEWIATLAEAHRDGLPILKLIAKAVGFPLEGDTIDLDDLLDQVRDAVDESRSNINAVREQLIDANKSISKLQALLDEARAAANANADEAARMKARASKFEAEIMRLSGPLGQEHKGTSGEPTDRQVEVPLPVEPAQPEAPDGTLDHSTLFQPGDPVTARQPGGQEEIGTVIRYDDRHGPTYWISYRDGRSEGQFPIDALTRRNADAPTEPELPAGVTRREYRAWLGLMQEAGISENLDPQEFKRLRDAGLVDWATLKAKAAKIDEEAGQIASSTGLEVGEHAELEAPNGKAVILERTKPHQPLGIHAASGYFEDVERYVLKTPRDRIIAQVALGTDNRWKAEVSFYPSPRFELLDEALAWVYAREKYTGGTSPADQAKKAKEAIAPPPTERQPAGVTPESSSVAPDGRWANDLDPAKAEHRSWPPALVTPEARIDAAKAEMAAAVDVTLETTDQNSPEWKAAEEKHAKAFAELQEAEEEKRKAAHPNPSAPAEVQAATRAIAEFEQLPPAHLEVGSLVTIVRHTGEIATGTLAYTWEGTDKWEVTLDGGGREVRPVNFIRGRAPEACPSCGGGPGLAYTCSCLPSDSDPSETAPEKEPAFNF